MLEGIACCMDTARGAGAEAVASSNAGAGAGAKAMLGAGATAGIKSPRACTSLSLTSAPVMHHAEKSPEQNGFTPNKQTCFEWWAKLFSARMISSVWGEGLLGGSARGACAGIQAGAMLGARAGALKGAKIAASGGIVAGFSGAGADAGGSNSSGMLTGGRAAALLGPVRGAGAAACIGARAAVMMLSSAGTSTGSAGPV